MIAILLTNC